MSGKCRPSLRAKTLLNVDNSNLSDTDKKCIHEVFARYDDMVEKQIPKKPSIKTYVYNATKDDFEDQYLCPACKCVIVSGGRYGPPDEKKQKHCDCGQALDWSDTE